MLLRLINEHLLIQISDKPSSKPFTTHFSAIYMRRIYMRRWATKALKKSRQIEELFVHAVATFTEYQWLHRSNIRAYSQFAPSKWETALLSNDVSHWLGASLESALNILWHVCTEKFVLNFNSLWATVFLTFQHRWIILLIHKMLIVFKNEKVLALKNSLIWPLFQSLVPWIYFCAVYIAWNTVECRWNALQYRKILHK